MVVSILVKIAGSIAMKLLTADALQDLFIWSAEKLAAHTDSKVDDELVALIKKHLGAVDAGQEQPKGE